MSDERTEDSTEDDTSEKAELDERDRSQPNLVTRRANRRADDDATPDREEREHLLEEVEEDG